MAANDQLSDGKGLTDFSVDPNVRVPDHVKAEAARAEAIHKQVYKEDLPQPVQPEHTHATPAAQPGDAAAAAEEAARAEAARAAAAAADPQPQHTDPQPKPGVSSEDEGVSAAEWRHRFLSMKGRFDAVTRQQGADRQQMQELADELTRTQSLLQAPASRSQAPATPRDHKKLITEQDRETYGDDLIDVARRVAMETVGPEIESLRAENQNLKKDATTRGQRELRDALRTAVPDWQAINTSPQFLQWLALPNIYTGQVRRDMLRAAYGAADAPRVIALFRDFVTEVKATGQTVQTPQGEQQEDKPAPRTAAVDLGTLAAPGKAKPASGDTAMPADKPFITRAQITKFYDDKRRGFYAGREALAAQFEADLTVAQREGRVR
jgi:hypothetical protein